MVRLIKQRKQINSSSGPEPSFPIKLFASGLYAGYVPFASGTLGSAIAAALYFIPGFESPIILGPIIFLVFVLGIKTSSVMEIKYGHDPSEVTIDEMAGMWISLFLLPKKIPIVLAAFVFFRFFDIIKLYPASKFDSKPGGFCIMMDDVVSGFYTNIIMRLLLFIPVVNEYLSR